MVPLTLIGAVAILLGIGFVAGRASRQRPRTLTVVAIGSGVLTLVSVTVLLYRQGIVADEMGTTPPPLAPFAALAVLGLLLIAVGAVAEARRNRGS